MTLLATVNRMLKMERNSVENWCSMCKAIWTDIDFALTSYVKRSFIPVDRNFREVRYCLPLNHRIQCLLRNKVNKDYVSVGVVWSNCEKHCRDRLVLLKSSCRIAPTTKSYLANISINIKIPLTKHRTSVVLYKGVNRGMFLVPI